MQETFVGFLTSLPNYDPATSLQSFLFSICAHKITDRLRSTGRRPSLLSLGTDDDGTPPKLPHPRPGVPPASPAAANIRSQLTMSSPAA